MVENRPGLFDRPAADHRLVVLGASNVARGISTLVRVAQQKFGKRIEIFFAAGHGRSYGEKSMALGRGLPGITECGLWKSLDLAPSLPTTALLTDIGNDIVYGSSVETIAEWVGCCLERLRPHSERLFITELPLESIASIGSLRYRIFRSIFFPKSCLDLATVHQRAALLNDQIIALALQNKVQLLSPRQHWYGIDPIHILSRYREEAWKTMLDLDEAERMKEPLGESLMRSVSLHLLRPQQRSIFGIEQHCEQPAGRFSDGTTVAIY